MIINCQTKNIVRKKLGMNVEKILSQHFDDQIKVNDGFIYHHSLS